MNPARILKTSLKAALLFYATSAIAQTPAMWNGLPKGAYEVGFKFERQYDHARPFQNKYDENGKIVKNRARPIQMFIWYPAARSADPKSLRYEEYLFLNDTEAEPWQWTDTQKLALRQKDGEEKQIAGEGWESILALETAAVKDAKAAAGKFPLVIFGAGGGTGGHVYSVLCEYLASHGYVAVALTALPLKKGERWPFDASGIDAQIRDLEFAINYAYRLPLVDTDKLALASWSVGGVTQALLQMRNSDVDALISLDAATGYEYGRDLLKQSIFLDFKKMNMPYLHAHGEGPVRYNVPKNFEYYDSLSVADAYLLTFKQLGHADFLPCYGAVPHAILKTERSAAVSAGFKALCQYVLNFLHAYLREDKNALEFLRNEPVSNGFSNEIVSLRAKLKK
jgi:dienelactone hydrolase